MSDASMISALSAEMFEAMDAIRLSSIRISPETRSLMPGSSETIVAPFSSRRFGVAPRAAATPVRPRFDAVERRAPAATPPRRPRRVTDGESTDGCPGLAAGDVKAGLDLTAHFLELFVFGPVNRPLPPARVWLVERLAEAERL